ncbi:lytic transglycosylase domain-containing protein [Subtercola frigoramans]|uniref:Membrane-bound lytic murein transglycosylase B n=1 Tax=Subtercola frigoramans TaxID=120298 RepID=A0ABS2L5A0_9MICO|nr:lytic transglycosylase domain-containing protein [Subtercola frigoramans]MBM7472209.1 membrane-bound lytic murein transglycosylase B [Subtercola frigoramans]
MRTSITLLVTALLALGGWLTYSAVTAPGQSAHAAIGVPGQTDLAALAPDAVTPVDPSPPTLPEPTSPTSSASGTSDASTTTAGPGLAGTTAGATGTTTSSNTGNSRRVDRAWAQRAVSATGIPYRAVLGYAGATIALQTEQPACHLGWSTLAALGNIESGHGTHAGSRIQDDGWDTPGIFGPSLDGTSYDAIAAAPTGTTGNAGGTSAQWARAAGPLQFIPSTWAQWGADGNADGVADPQQIDDAALTAGRYLCSYGDLSTAAGWRASVFAYNHVETYVDSVAATANLYAAEVG